MNNRRTTCDPERIELFLEQKLSDVEQTSFESHLSNCGVCRQRLQSAAASEDIWDEVCNSLRDEQPHPDDLRSGDSDSPDEDSTSQTTVLKLLAPTDDDRMLGRWGTYEVVGVVGTGGMGVVLKAFDAALNRYVAIKVLAPHLGSSGAARKRFSREAQASAAVVHDNVIEIYGVSEATGLPYLVMPYVRGPSLQRRLDDEGALAVVEILRVGMQAAAGLAAAHAQGLVHRDVKPANILLADGIERVKLTDFGLARAADDASLTKTGIIAGTPQYMSPEQARGEPVDRRSDLFSLGSVLYAMCTGRPPFRAETSYGVLRRITDEEPRPIREINPDIPDWLCGIVAKLMAKLPEDRFQSAGEVAVLLEQCLAHIQQPTVVPLPAYSPLPPGEGEGVRAACRPEQACAVPARIAWSRSKRFLATAIGLLFFGGLVLAFGILIHLKKDGRTTTIEVPEGATARVDPQGAVTVELPSTLAGGAKRGAETVSGTVLESVIGRFFPPRATAAFSFPPDISGNWHGEDWGRITLTQTAPGEYTGTYTDTVAKEKGLGKIELKWSGIEGRFNGTWREGDDRFGNLSVLVKDSEIRGAFTIDPKSKIHPAPPRLAELAWTRAEHAANDAKAAPPPSATGASKDIVVAVNENHCGPWAGRLANGISVELMAVGKDDRWWQANGSPLAAPPCNVTDWPFGSHDPDSVLRTFIVRLSGPSLDQAAVNVEVSPQISTQRFFHGEQGHFTLVTLPVAARTVTTRWGVSSGDWKDAALAVFSADGRPFGPGSSGDLLKVLNVLYNNDGINLKMPHQADAEHLAIVTTDDGREQTQRFYEFQGSDAAYFNGLRYEHVRKIKLQRRPYAWVEFRGVPTQWSDSPVHCASDRPNVCNVAAEAKGPWTARLENGVTVELTGVWGGDRWWRPDGSPWADPPWHFDLRQPPSDKVFRRFFVEFNGLPAKAGTSVEVFADAHSEASEKVTRVALDAANSGSLCFETALPAANRSLVALRCGVATGLWQESTSPSVLQNATFIGGGCSSGAHNVNLDGRQSKEGVVASVDEDWFDRDDLRLVAITFDGRAVTGPATIDHPQRQQTQTNIKVTFPGLLLKEIKDIHVERRPYTWGCFSYVKTEKVSGAEKALGSVPEAVLGAFSTPLSSDGIAWGKTVDGVQLGIWFNFPNAAKRREYRYGDLVGVEIFARNTGALVAKYPTFTGGLWFPSVSGGSISLPGSVVADGSVSSNENYMDPRASRRVDGTGMLVVPPAWQGDPQYHSVLRIDPGTYKLFYEDGRRSSGILPVTVVAPTSDEINDFRRKHPWTGPPSAETAVFGAKRKGAENQPGTGSSQVVPASQNILKNSGAEAGNTTPDGWQQGAAVDGVSYSWCKTTSFGGKASLCIAKTAESYYPVAQWSQTVDRQGDRPELLVSAQVKALNMTYAVLDVSFLSARGELISHQSAAVIGSGGSGWPANHDWKLYSGKVPIPPRAKKLRIGLQDIGPGKVWFDDIRAAYAGAEKSPGNASESVPGARSSAVSLRLSFDQIVYALCFTGAKDQPVFVDLDTGRYMVPPRNLWNPRTESLKDMKFTPELTAWIRRLGIDAAVQTDGKSITFVGFDLNAGNIILPSKDGKVPDLSPMEVLQRVGPTVPGQFTTWAHKFSAPEFFMLLPFHTREGGIGNLHIWDITDLRGPDTVGLRYQLTRPQSAEHKTPPVPEPAILGQFEGFLKVDTHGGNLQLRLPPGGGSITFRGENLIVSSPNCEDFEAARICTGFLDVDAVNKRVLVFGRGRQATLTPAGNKVRIEMGHQVAEADEIPLLMPELKVWNTELRRQMEKQESVLPTPAPPSATPPDTGAANVPAATHKSEAGNDDVGLMQRLVDTVRANKGSIRTWKGTATCEFEREETTGGNTYAEKCKRSIEFATDVARGRSRSGIIIDALEQSVDGVKRSPLPDNYAAMIKDGRYYDFTWKSPDKEGTVIENGKPVKKKGSGIQPNFRALSEIPPGIRKSVNFFDPLMQMDYEFRDGTADFDNLISECKRGGTRSLPPDFKLYEKEGVFAYSRTIQEPPNFNGGKTFIEKETFDLNKGGLMIESSHTVEKDGKVVSKRTSKTVPQKVGGAWIPKESFETVFEPDCKMDYRLKWISNEINVPVDDEFTFAKMRMGVKDDSFPDRGFLIRTPEVGTGPIPSAGP